MRLDLAAGSDTFQCATGTGDHRKVVAEIPGPLVGPEVPSEKECQKLLGESSRSAWCINGDGDSLRVRFVGFQSIWVAKIMHEGEKLRGALKAGKANEEEIRTAWRNFHLGAAAPGSGKATPVVMSLKELIEYCDGDQDVAMALAEKLKEKGAKIT